MTKKYYVDSNVFLSYFKSETGGITKMQVERTLDFLKHCIKQGNTIILSDLTLKEIEENSYYTKKEVKEWARDFGIKYITTETTFRDQEKAEEIQKKTKIHHPDNIHVQLALKTNADTLVTWNKKDFKKAKRLIKPSTPENILFESFFS